jgi:hypothetical protein
MKQFLEIRWFPSGCKGYINIRLVDSVSEPSPYEKHEYTNSEYCTMKGEWCYVSFMGSEESSKVVGNAKQITEKIDDMLSALRTPSQ